MQRSACVFALLMISQMFWTAGAVDGHLVRKSSRVVAADVAADGTIVEDNNVVKSKKGLVRKTDKVVSADGTITEEKDAVTEGDQLSDDHAALLAEASDAKDLLERVEALVQDKEFGNRNAILEIQKLAQELLPEVKKERDDEAEQVAINLKAIETCNAGSVQRQKTIETGDEKTVNGSRSLHVNCRQKEGTAEKDMEAKCGALDEFLDAMEEATPKPDDRDPAVTWVKGQSTYWCKTGEEVDELDEKCTKAEDLHNGQKKSCDEKQAVFESGFCEWRTALLDECQDLASCYHSALEAYNKHVKSTKDLLEKLKTEWKSLKKVLCYVDVWVNKGDASTVDASQYQKCVELDPTAEANKELNIDFGVVPAQTSCDTALVNIHPGTSEFPSTEYAAFANLSATSISCLNPMPAVTVNTAAPAHVWNRINCEICFNNALPKIDAANVEECFKKCDPSGKTKLSYNYQFNVCICYDDKDCSPRRSKKLDVLECPDKKEVFHEKEIQQ